MKRLRNVLFATLASIGLVVGTPGVANAGVSYLTNGGWIALYGAPSIQYSQPIQWSRNGTKFQMICWLDNEGRRWFWGQVFDTGRHLYARADQVGAQSRVGHC